MSDRLKMVAAIIVSALGALGVALMGIGSDAGLDDIDTKNWLIAGVAVLGSGGMVALVTNIPGVVGGAIKALIAFLTAGFGVLIISLDPNENGVVAITTTEWLAAAATAILATGFVYEAPGPDSRDTA